MVKSKKKRTYLPRVGSIVTLTYIGGDARAKKARVTERLNDGFRFKVLSGGSILSRGMEARWGGPNDNPSSSTWKILRGSEK